MIHRLFFKSAEAIRSSFRGQAVARPRRRFVPRLESLEGRDVPAPIAPIFYNGDVNADLDHHPFPASSLVNEIPSGSKITVTFESSDVKQSGLRAEVTLDDGGGTPVQTKFAGPGQSITLTYAVTRKSPVPWDVTVQNVGETPMTTWAYLGFITIKLPDITVSTAKYFGDNAKVHKNPTGVQATVSVPKDFNEPFKVALYRSKDGVHPYVRILTVGVNPDGKGGSVTVKIDTKRPLQGEKSVPFLVVIADSDKKIPEQDEDNNSDALDLPYVVLTLPKELTLNEKADFKIDPGLQDKTHATSYKVELRQTGEGDPDYKVLGTGSASPLKLKPTLAKNVDYLPSVMAEGKRFFGPAKNKKVLFPLATTIRDNADVQKYMATLWVNSVNDELNFNGTQWHELGAYILLNTKTGKYTFSKTVAGDWGKLVLGEPKGGNSISAASFKQPNDAIDSATQTGIYVVAWFHTHPDNYWQAAPPTLGKPQTYGRPVGPSGADGDTGFSTIVLGLPGFAFDYIGTNAPFPDGTILTHIPPGWDPNADAKPYDPFGPARRVK